MSIVLQKGPYPGRPKILFIGLADSSHTQAWINLLAGGEFNVRLFAMPYGPSLDWPLKTDLSGTAFQQSSTALHYKFSFIYKVAARNIGLLFPWLFSARLANVIKQWKPDIIHTLGLFDGQGGQFYFDARRKFHLESYGKWILQLRGGSDMELRRHNPKFRGLIQQALSECEQIICDNRTNIKYAGELGIPPSKFASIVPVPGTGGIDLVSDDSDRMSLPSKRERIIL